MDFFSLKFLSWPSAQITYVQIWGKKGKTLCKYLGKTNSQKESKMLTWLDFQSFANAVMVMFM